jgi:hypothetical protein
MDRGGYYDLSTKSEDMRSFLRAKEVERKRSRKYGDDEPNQQQLADVETQSTSLRGPEQALLKESTEHQEKRALNAFSSAVFGVYFRSAFGLLTPILVLVLFVSTQVLVMMADYYPLIWYNLLND